jgi:hypothetical protein
MNDILSRSRLIQVLNRLEHFLEVDGWKGWDPYDALSSGFIRMLTFGWIPLRTAATQLMRKSPLNLRNLFKVPRGINPKAMGLIACAYLNMYTRTNNKEFLKKAESILRWLVHNSSTGYSGYCWGYDFDWQSRAFFLPKGTPTLVNTSFIGKAFLKAYELLKEEKYLKIARSACDFILYDTNHLKEHDMVSFSYTPIDHYYVHNATALGSSLLASVQEYTQEEDLAGFARKSMLYVVHHQNDDGGWHYGESETAMRTGIDSFHTGFILSSLKQSHATLDYRDKNRIMMTLSKGYEYYKKTFWEEDGCPRYFAHKKYPIDLHCSAQGVITCLEFEDHARARQIASWAINNMWDDTHGYFYFQKTKRYTNRIPYLRWPNAWMFLALSCIASL